MKVDDEKHGNSMEQLDAIPPKIIEFSRLVEKEGLHGLHFQHIVLCTRRAWFHLNRIDYAHLDERMANGTVMHETSRPRDPLHRGIDGTRTGSNRLAKPDRRGGESPLGRKNGRVPADCVLRLAALGVHRTAVASPKRHHRGTP